MSKRITVPWYIVAWGVWAIALLAYAGPVRPHPEANVSVVMVAPIAAAVAAIVTIGMWAGALVRLGRQHAWGWFVAVLILQLVGLGIVGMIVYGISGPADVFDPVVVRPGPRPVG